MLASRHPINVTLLPNFLGLLVRYWVRIFAPSHGIPMKSNDGAKLHMAAKRRGLRAGIDGETVAFYAGERRVWRGPDHEARDFLATLKTTSKAQRDISRLKQKRRDFRKVRAGDVGIESTDHAPRDARGLVLTRVMLPPEISGDDALIALWAGENIATGRAAPAISGHIGAARSAMVRAKPIDVWLSDHDRTSLGRYAAPASVVLIAAALARRLPHKSR